MHLAPSENVNSPPLLRRRRLFHGPLAGLLGLLFFAIPPAHADTLHLKDGTVLVGTREKEEDGKIYFLVESLGPVIIDASQVVAQDDPAASPPAIPPEPPPAEAPPAPKPVPEPAPAPAPASTPPAPQSSATTTLGAAGQGATKPVWGLKASAGLSYTSAPFKQGEIADDVTGASLGLPGRQIGSRLAATLTRATAAATLALDGQIIIMDVQPIGRVAQNYLAVLSAMRRLNDTYYVASRSSYFYDKVRNIDYSVLQLLGVGRMLINRPTTKLELIPGAFLLIESKGLETDHDPLFGAGFLENFSHAFNPFVLLEQRMLFRTTFEDFDFTAVEVYVGFKGMLMPGLGVQIGVTVNHDRSLSNLPLPNAPMPTFANETTQIMTTAGLEYTR